MKKFLAVIMIMLFSFTIIGCMGEKKEVKKTLKVGMTMSLPPFEFTDSKEKKVKGFDVDLMEALAKEMGVGVEFQNIDFDHLLHTLEIGNLDLVISALTVTKERENIVSFTKPYYESGLVIAVRSDNKKIRSYTDLPGAKVGVVIGTTSAHTLSEQQSITLLEHKTLADAFNSLLNQKVDAVVGDKPSVDYFINNHENEEITRLPVVFKTEHYAIATNKDNNELRENLNEALQNIKDKGVYDKLYVKWFGGEEVPK